MLNRNNGKQDKFVVTTLEQLMPENHFLRDLESLVDFTFIYDKVAHMYSSLGRKSVDPVVLVKMILIGFLYGIDSERKLEKEVQVNIAYRWFLGIDLDEPVPDHSTISQTRRRKWKDSNIFEDIFTEIVQKCIDVGLVDGSLILTDSTHVKANASNEKYKRVTVIVEPREYIRKLDKLCEEEDLKVRAEAISKGKKKRGYEADKAPKTREVTKSTTDPDSGKLARPGKPNGFHYLSHQSVDGKSGIVTDVYVTPANTEDFEPYVDRIKHHINKYGFIVSEVGIDSGYDYEEIHKEMYDLGIKTYIPLIDMEKVTRSRVYPPSSFNYDSERDAYICPNGCVLKYSSVNKSKRKKIYRASQRDCNSCPLKASCCGGSVKHRTLMVSPFKEEIDLQRANYGTTRYYEVQRRRRVFCEGNFAVQKDNHNLRRTRKRGNGNVTEHCLCSAMALNLKKLVKHLKTKGYPRIFRYFSTHLSDFLKNAKEDLNNIKSSFIFNYFVNRPEGGPSF
jgi:transposase